MDPATLILRARQRACMTQRELARRAGTSAAAICLYESGRRIPRVDTLARIVTATGARLDCSVRRAPDIDLHANAASLVAVLDLADHLPSRSTLELAAPVMRDLVDGPIDHDPSTGDIAS